MTDLLLSFAIAMLVPASAPSHPAGAILPTSLDLTAVRELTVQHDGRWPPFDTLARDTVESITGEAFYNRHDPVLVLLAMTFDASHWMQAPMIQIGNAELRGELELSGTQTSFSYFELVSHQRLRTLIEELRRKEKGEKLDPLEGKVSGINGKLGILQSVFSNAVIRPVPSNGEVADAWLPIRPGATDDTAKVAATTKAWDELKVAFLADDATAFATASAALVAGLNAFPAAYRPSAELIATELNYNELRPYHKAWMAMIVGTILAAIALWSGQRWLDKIALAAMVVGFGLLSYGLWLRWEIAGHIPASNMFESLLFLSWGMGAFAILSVFLFSDRLVVLTASMLGAVALMLADVLPLDAYIRPTTPVLLDTVWMAIHVPVIMVSYSVLALGVLIAHVQLVMMAAAPLRRNLTAKIDSLHYLYIHVGSILLLAGIATGSMWAASSWGRYWGWDPKEVWSLVALLGYLTILHVRIDREQIPRWAYWLGGMMAIALLALVVPKLAPLTGAKIAALGATVAAMVIFVATRGPFATALKSILCFWLIIMTYVGVNYVLGIGLHSYGFGTGAVARRMLLVGGIDLGLVLLCCAIYLARRKLKPATVNETMVTLTA